MQRHATATMRHHATATMQHHAAACNVMQHHAMPCNTMQHCTKRPYNSDHATLRPAVVETRDCAQQWQQTRQLQQEAAMAAVETTAAITISSSSPDSSSIHITSHQPHSTDPVVPSARSSFNLITTLRSTKFLLSPATPSDTTAPQASHTIRYNCTTGKSHHPIQLHHRHC